MSPDDALRIAKDAYTASTTYVDANYRQQWEDALRMFQGRHPAGSKYNSETYKYRSRLFRPKTRSVIRRHEAIAAGAFFANTDVISTSAMDDLKPEQVASAAIVKELLNYRLSKSIPWFVTVMGAVQDAATVGVVASYQYWRYRAKKGPKQMQVVGVDEAGMPIAEEFQDTKVLEDKPCVELMPVENLRIDPAAKWYDPVNTSPYMIRMVPMYVQDVRSMMSAMDDKTGQPKWKRLSDGEIRAASKTANDTTRLTREKQREDSLDVSQPLNDFEIVWCHENFVRRDDEEWVYWTLGTEHVLTDPKPLAEVYFHGERPVTMGCMVLETHKTFPEGLAALGKDLQTEANDIVNQRLDNVKLVLNKRWFVRSGANIDLESIQRNVAGGVTLMPNPETDVREVNWPDVTASAFQEQDRVNVDYDELLGNFSQSSVSTNRSLNETVGGMGLISNGANMMAEYDVRVFTETWLEPTLRQLVKLEQAYETDPVVLALAGEKAQLFQKFGIDQITDDLLMQDLTLTVNMGEGASNPQFRLQKFVGALQTYANIAAAGLPDVNLQEVGKELMALSGYKDGKRFLNSDIDPRAMQMAQQQVMQQMGPQIEAAQTAVADAEKAAQQAEQERMAHQQTKMQLIDLKAQMDVQKVLSGLDDEKARIESEKVRLELEKIEAKYAREVDQFVANMRQQLMDEKQAEQEAKASEPEKESEPAGPEKPAMPVINLTIGGQPKKVSIKAPSGQVYEGSIAPEGD